jgi:hypothetical protein
MVVICTVNLRKTLRSFKNLMSHKSSTGSVDQDKENTSDDEIEEIVENEGK